MITKWIVVMVLYSTVKHKEVVAFYEFADSRVQCEKIIEYSREHDTAELFMSRSQCTEVTVPGLESNKE